MFLANQIVEYCGNYGRVIYHDPVTYNVHVLLRINPNTWKIEKCDQLFCKPVEMFLWSVDNVFRIKYLPKTRTPQLKPVRVEEDYVMKI